MQISAYHPDREALKTAAIPFLTRLLDAPTLSGAELPAVIKGYIYVGGRALLLGSGTWEQGDGTFYLGRSGGKVDTFTKLGVLGAIASITGAVEDTAIVDKLSGRLVQAIQEDTASVYASLIRVERTRPTRLAIDQVNARVAAELNGAWRLSSGAPVKVDDKWIIMDF